jgi:phosphoglycerate dehydrogenase-like enzyme
MEPLTLWTNFAMPPDKLAAVQAQLSPHRLLYFEGKGPDTAMEQAQVVFGQPDLQQAVRSRNLKWLHISTAGYDRYDREELRQSLKARGAIMTNSSSVFAEPCAQHLLAMMLSMTRRLNEALDNQRGPRAWICEEIRFRSRLLGDQNVLMVGYGAIARRLTELLAPFEPPIIAARRTVRGDEPVRTVPMDQLNEHLPWADHVLNILPMSPTTQSFFDASRFALMKPTAVFYNIGRGRTVDQSALRSALSEGRIAAAYLDVMHPEPLPSDDPLWTTPNCFIVPHTGGGFPNERDAQVKHFLTNLKRYERGEILLDRIF